MGLLKAVLVGFLASLLLAGIASSLPDRLAGAVRWASFDFTLGTTPLTFSFPVFVTVTLVCWIFVFGWRD
jgi:hypothetical protein